MDDKKKFIRRLKGIEDIDWPKLSGTMWWGAEIVKGALDSGYTGGDIKKIVAGADPRGPWSRFWYNTKNVFRIDSHFPWSGRPDQEPDIGWEITAYRIIEHLCFCRLLERVISRLDYPLGSIQWEIIREDFCEWYILEHDAIPMDYIKQMDEVYGTMARREYSCV